ncbi:helix-turn-helix domain-containing protein [Ancylobacter sp.]|uniref:helix-turn-helix domain-containing protein n=1 Tax=Ancylobacter sp. TaxID=1872567 RepID=UPI003D131BF8
MSVQAVAWALDQYITDAATKLVLISLANYADKRTGECWPTIARICEESCQSKSTVLRRIGWLIEQGLVEKTEVHEASGRQRANHYRLMIMKNLTRDDVASTQGCFSDVHGGGCQAETLPVSGEGVTADTPEGVTADTPIEPLEEPKVSPIAPKGAVRGETSKGWEQDPTYLAFLAEYGPSQAWPKHRGHRQWLKLTDDERKAAIAAIPLCRATCLKERRKMSDPSTYLRGTFKNFTVRLTPRAPESEAVKALRRALGPNFTGGVMVEHGSPQWAAWQAVADEAQLPLRAIGYAARPFAGRPKAVTGRYMPSEWPPSRDGPDRQQQQAAGG